MSGLEDFLGPQRRAEEPPPEGMDFYASVLCQYCGEPVDTQTLFPSERILVWLCSKNHRSMIEGFSAF